MKATEGAAWMNFEWMQAPVRRGAKLEFLRGHILAHCVRPPGPPPTGDQCGCVSRLANNNCENNPGPLA
jgi:hypothetical protein